MSDDKIINIEFQKLTDYLIESIETNFNDNILEYIKLTELSKQILSLKVYMEV